MARQDCIVVLDDQLVRRIDRLTEAGGRSKFIRAAVRARLDELEGRLVAAVLADERTA